jgi:hypothetical protein
MHATGAPPMYTQTGEAKIQVYNKKMQSNTQLVKRREGARKKCVRNARVNRRGKKKKRSCRHPD